MEELLQLLSLMLRCCHLHMQCLLLMLINNRKVVKHAGGSARQGEEKQTAAKAIQELFQLLHLVLRYCHLHMHCLLLMLINIRKVVKHAGGSARQEEEKRTATAVMRKLSQLLDLMLRYNHLHMQCFLLRPMTSSKVVW